MNALRTATTFDPATLVRHVKPGPRYTSYPPATEFAADFVADDARKVLTKMGQDGGTVSLYCHVPFCRSLCWYCGCNVVVSRRRDRDTEYVSRLVAELAALRTALGARLRLAEFSLGGGSPNFLRADALERLVCAVRRHFAVADDAELGVELDPRETTRAQVATLAALGFRRVSVGVQDFAAETQAAINRFQSVAQTAAVLDAARALGFATANVDLVYGLPAQTEASLGRTLDEVLAMAPTRVALFGYAHLPDRLPHQKLVERRHRVPGPELRARLLSTALERLDRAGYRRIGLDHFARPDDSLARAAADGALHRNFQGYAVRRADHLLGIGASAISDTGGAYWQNEPRLDRWNQRVDARELPVARGVALSADDRLRRDVIMEVMCRGRVGVAGVEQRHGVVFDRYFSRELEELTTGVASALCRVDSELRYIEVTDAGRLLVRNIAMVFDAYLADRLAAATRRTFSPSL